jgi:hypothetical protein
MVAVDAERVGADAARVERGAERDVALARHDGPAERARQAAPGGLDLLPLVEDVAVGRADELDLWGGRIGGDSRRREAERGQGGDEDREAE